MIQMIGCLLSLVLLLPGGGHGQQGQLRFVTQQFEPFTFAEKDGGVSGPVTKLVEAVCAEADIRCAFSLLPWTRAQKQVREGKAQGMFVIGWNQERAAWLYFSPPILSTEYGFFVRTDNPLQFRQPSDVRGYRVGVYGPSNTSKVLEQIRDEVRDLNIDLRPDDESGFRKLALGRVDAVFSNRDVGLALIREEGLGTIRYAGAYSSLKYYVGFSRDFTDKGLVDRFNAAYKRLYAGGQVKKLLEQAGLEAVAPH